MRGLMRGESSHPTNVRPVPKCWGARLFDGIVAGDIEAERLEKLAACLSLMEVVELERLPEFSSSPS
eukprot:7390501-Prymnesium_polylepis.3